MLSRWRNCFLSAWSLYLLLDGLGYGVRQGVGGERREGEDTVAWWARGGKTLGVVRVKGRRGRG